jgi:hypothetical protein
MVPGNVWNLALLLLLTAVESVSLHARFGGSVVEFRIRIVGIRRDAGQRPSSFDIRGNLFILVLVEMDPLCQIAIDKGYKATFDQGDELYPLCVEVPGGDGMAGISGHILARIGMEFLSPAWIVLFSIEGLERAFETVGAEFSAAPSA